MGEWWWVAKVGASGARSQSGPARERLRFGWGVEAGAERGNGLASGSGWGGERPATVECHCQRAVAGRWGYAGLARWSLVLAGQR